MRKYLFIIKSEVMSTLQYIGNVFGNITGFIIILIILFNLWNYLYSDPNELINGYSMNQMIWYVVITELIWSIVGGRKLVNKISDDVKSGGVAYKITKPYSYIGYFMSEQIGSTIIKGFVYIVIGLVIGIICTGTFPSLGILEMLIFLVIFILSFIISILTLIAIGLVSFFIEDSKPLYWLYSKLILVLGTVFPIEFFPKFLQKILCFSPIYVINYGPAKMFVSFNYIESLKIFIAQLIYIIVFYGICKLLYEKGVKKINVNGG